MNNQNANLIQRNSPDGGMLQSEEWRKFQESFGRKTFNISGDGYWANVIEHKLPLVGSYFYMPRGPVFGSERPENIKRCLDQVLRMAADNNVGWIRIEPANNEILKQIKSNIILSVRKAPHNMQPKEILVADISLPEEDILAQMKQKTRYNVRLAKKKGVTVDISRKKEDLEKFINLVKITAKRNGIYSHPGDYYRKMVSSMPDHMIKLYLAMHEREVIAANLVCFYGGMATYLHGASDDRKRNLMAPYLLQWRQIQDAKSSGCAKYDFGGIKAKDKEGKSWEGVSNFKLGFSPGASSVEFPGSYDIVVNPMRYQIYKVIQKIKSITK